MGITSTINELSVYFEEWHKKKYEKLHQITNDKLNEVYNIIFAKPDGLQARLQKLEINFQNLLSAYNTLTEGTTSTIKNLDDKILANSNNIINLNNNKVNKNDITYWRNINISSAGANHNSDITFIVNETLKLAQLTGKVNVWSTSKTVNSTVQYYEAINSTPSTGSAYYKVANNNKIFFTVPAEYRPDYHAASCSVSPRTTFYLSRQDGRLKFNTTYNGDSVNPKYIYMLWHYR